MEDTSVLTAIEVLDKAIRPLLETEEERMSFEIRKGVTFVDYEIILTDYIDSIDQKGLELKLANGSIENYARGLVYRMRNRRLAPNPAYSRKDLVREVNSVLRGIVEPFGRVPLSYPHTITEYLVENRRIVEALKHSCEVHEKDETLLDTPTEKLGIPNRAINALIEAGYHTIRHMIARTYPDLCADVMGMGPAGSAALKSEIERMGLDFKPHFVDKSHSRIKGARKNQEGELSPPEVEKESTNE